MGSKTILMPAFLIASTSMISRKRERYMRRGSIACDSAFFELGSCGLVSKAVIADSMAFVTSGRAGAPSGVENFMPLYSGGLCDAVKLIAPSALDSITEYEIAGVGAGSAITSGVTP